MTRTKPAADQQVRPFLKWAGGKRRLLPYFQKYLPRRYGHYYEPFAGAGALFFSLSPDKATLADTNQRLMRTYQGLRDHPQEVIRLLRGYPHEKSFFLELRQQDIDEESDAQVAAWLIYLNKTAFNGLYRVNSKNGFNVPFGRYKNPNICDEKRLLACAARLEKVTIVHGDFEDAVEGACKGDLVYFDPPYAPLSRTSSFTAYTAGGFSEEDQVRLRDRARLLVERGVHVLISNSSAPLIKKLYKDDFQLVELPARRSINSRASGRGTVTELLILSRSASQK